MARSTNQEYADVHFTYGRADDIASFTRRL